MKTCILILLFLAAIPCNPAYAEDEPPAAVYISIIKATPARGYIFVMEQISRNTHLEVVGISDKMRNNKAIHLNGLVTSWSVPLEGINRMIFVAELTIDKSHEGKKVIITRDDFVNLPVDFQTKHSTETATDQLFVLE